VLSLAIGIGLNAAVFSVVDWVLLRPLPYPAPHELVRVFTAGIAPITPPAALTYGEFERFGRAESLRSAAAFSTATRIMAAPGIDPVHVAIARVAGDLFATLGTRPDIGRAFTPEEKVSGAPVVILAHDLWQRRFAGDRAIVGRAVTIDGALHTVIGIMPAAQGYPAGAEVWRPLRAVESDDKKDRELQMIGRLRAGAGIAGASAEIATMARTLSNGARDAWADDMQRTDVRRRAGRAASALRRRGADTADRLRQRRRARRRPRRGPRRGNGRPWRPGRDPRACVGAGDRRGSRPRRRRRRAGTPRRQLGADRAGGAGAGRHSAACADLTRRPHRRSRSGGHRGHRPRRRRDAGAASLARERENGL
jgi:hypothetical protein